MSQRWLALVVASLLAGDTVAFAQTWSIEEQVASGDDLQLAFNNATPLARTGLDVHVVYTLAGEPRHARRDASSERWVLQPLPRLASGRASKATLFAIGDEVLLAAWNAAGGRGTGLVVALSRDGGRSWDSPLQLSLPDAQVSGISIHGWSSGGRARAVIGYHDIRDDAVLTTAWDGQAWSTSNWTLPELRTPGAGEDIAVFGAGAQTTATWDDGSDVFVATSSDGGSTWSDSLRVGPGGDPSGCLSGDGTLRLGWQRNGQVFVASGPEGEAPGDPELLGPGLFAATTCVPGAWAVAWEHFDGDSLDDSGKTVGLALGAGSTTAGPHAMPDSDDAFGRVLVSAHMDGGWLDVVWIDTRGATRRLIQRSARLQ